MLSNVVSSFTFFFDKPWNFLNQSRTFLAIPNTITDLTCNHYPVTGAFLAYATC